MLIQLKKLIRVNWDDLALCGGVVGGAFLLIHIVTALAVRFSGERSSLLLSGVILPIVAGILMLIISFSHTMFQFDWAVRYSRTRRSALGLTLGLVGFESLFTMGVAALLNLLEQTFAPGFWLWLSGAQTFAIGRESAVILPDGIPYDQVLQIEDFSLAWWWLPVIALGCIALGLISGAIVLRFGGKGGWFLWALFMAGCLSPQLLPWKTHTIVNWLFPLLGLLVLAGLIWSVWSLLHAAIKN